MKKFLMCLMLCAGMAQADTLAILRNQSNGVIVLTDMKDGCSRYPGAAYAVNGNSNKTYWGCWYSDDMMIHIDWKDGEKTSYLVENFTMNAENIRKWKDRKNGGGQSL